MDHGMEVDGSERPLGNSDELYPMYVLPDLTSVSRGREIPGPAGRSARDSPVIRERNRNARRRELGRWMGNYKAVYTVYG